MFGIIWRYELCLFTLEPNISGVLKCLGVMEGPRFQYDVILFFIQRLVIDSDSTITAKETFHLSSAVCNPLKMFQRISKISTRFHLVESFIFHYQLLSDIS